MRKGLTEHIEERQSTREKALFFGIVSKVWGKEDNKPETGNIEVNVKNVNNRGEFNRIPYTNSDHPGHVSVPQPGDSVIVDFTKGHGKQPVAVGLSADDRDAWRSPNAKEGHWRHEWKQRPRTEGEEVDNDPNGDGSDEYLYLEAQPKDGSGGHPEIVRMAIKSDGLGEPTTEVTVDNSGDETKVNINSDGNVSVETTDDPNGNGGDVSVDANGDVSVAAREDGNGNGGSVSINVDKGVSINASGEVTVTGSTVKANSEKVVTESAQMNDTFLGLGGGVSNPGST